MSTIYFNCIISMNSILTFNKILFLSEIFSISILNFIRIFSMCLFTQYRYISMLTILPLLLFIKFFNFNTFSWYLFNFCIPFFNFINNIFYANEFYQKMFVLPSSIILELFNMSTLYSVLLYMKPFNLNTYLYISSFFSEIYSM